MSGAPGAPSGHERFVHAWLLRLDPAWRRLAAAERRTDVDDFCIAVARAEQRLTQFAYSTIGLRAEGDLLLWRMAERLEDVDETAADMLAAGIGRWLTSAISMVGLTRPSQYVRRPTSQEQNLFTGERSRYLVVYPFVKSTDWYLSSEEERRRQMAEHIKVGRRYPMIQQLLAYSYGLDDQEFIVAYETDDLGAFQDLVRDLRSTEGRRATVRDTPQLVGVHRPLDRILELIGP